MSGEREISDRLLRLAASTSNESTQEERNFSSLVAITRRHFRRNDITPSPRKGRKRKKSFKKQIVLMKLAHADFFPSNVELKFLKQRGLGISEEVLEIERDSSLDEIKEDIISLFRPHIQNLLRMCGFKLARVEKTKKISHLGDIQNGADLENQLLQSKIIVLPLNDFPDNLPIIEEPDLSVSSTLRNSSTQPLIHTYERDSDSDSIGLHQVSSNSSSVSRSPGTSSLSRRSSRIIQYQIVDNDEEEFHESEDDQLDIRAESIAEKCLMFPSLPENAEDITIHVCRSNCLHDLMNFYMDENVVDKKLCVCFLGEIGIDGGGLTKEMFNLFFIKCEGIFFQGEDCLVPYLELNRLNELDKFVIIGRILQHMLLLTNQIPIKLSRITLMLIANPEKHIESDVLLQELLRYVNPYLRKILKKAQKDFLSLTEKENEVIQDFFQAHRFFAKPNSDTLSDQLNITATEILVEKPKRLIAKIRHGVSPEKHADFWKNCDFNVLLDMQTPTATKVVNCLVTDPHLTNEESDVLHYFTMYIQCIDRDKLANLLFLITGSFLMPDSINVKFNETVGLSQRPIFTTCTDTITLPKTYAHYDDLKNDLNM